MRDKIRNIFKIKSKRNDQLRYLSQPAFLEEAVYPPLMIRSVILVSAILLLFLIWSSVAKISEVALAPGEVIPGNYIQLIQHLEGGIISEINVTEGQMVEEGQLLAKLDGLDFKKDLQRVKLKLLDLQLQAERLNAFVKSQEPDFDKITNEHEDLKQEQMKMFVSMKKSKKSSLDVVKKQIKQKEELVKNLENKKEILLETKDLVQQEYDMKQKLFEKGAISKVAYIDISKQFNEVKGKIAEAASNISRAKSSMSEFNDRFVSLESGHLDEFYEKLEDVKSQIIQNSEIKEKLVDKVSRLEIKSPAKGLVKKIEVTTVGGVVAPGQPIMDIMPIGESLMVECKIMPIDIGNIKIGQDVNVNISAFDFSTYGSIAGKLVYLSATTMEDHMGRKYYVGKVKLDKNYVGDNPGYNIIVPGMTVQTNIITGQRTLLSYILKPIQTSLDTAFSER